MPDIIIRDFLACNVSPLMALQPFIWFAKYEDDSEVYEVNNDRTDNKFDIIEKDRLKEFGLLGNSGRIYFNTTDGIFHLDGGRDLNVFFTLDNGKKICITDNKDSEYKDIIQFKKGNFDFSMTDPNTKQHCMSSVAANYIGYKNKIVTDYLSFNYQLIYCLPANGPYTIILKITPDRDIKPELHLTYAANDDHNVVELVKDQTSKYVIRF